MNNFQLYRTNLYLGGQMKWDIIINNDANTLYVSDFHLSPISNNISYNYKTDEYLIKNMHQDNIKLYYTENKGNFYNPALDSEFNYTWPTICNKNEILNAYSNVYDMGCRRSKRYKIHNKQFEFLCPIWIEHLTDELSFKFTVKYVNTDKVIASKKLYLSTHNNSFHNKFVTYFDNYISDAGLKQEDDNILNISFKTNTATIHGLNASNGLFETREINSLVENMLHRERPLMEVDDMLIKSFVDNTILCKQLFNLNFIFNIEDIMSPGLMKLMKGEDVTISVDAYMGDDLLEKRDFNTEYDYLAKDVQNKIDIEYKENVLDYLHDYECIDLITKNKLVQNICHWSLCNNDDYIFNVYDGFSGLYIDEKTGDIYENSHQYGIAPNIRINKDDRRQNPTGWINTYDISNWSAFYKYVKNTNKYKTNGVHISDNNFINGLQYTKIAKIDSFTNGIYIVGLVAPNNVISSIVDNFQCTALYESSLYVMNVDNLFIILSNNRDLLTFNRFKNILYSLQSIDIQNVIHNQFVREIYNMMLNVVVPNTIVFNNSLQYTCVDGPSKDITEISYFKNDNAFNYVVRYCGKIRPNFVKKRTSMFYKDYISDNALGSKLKNSVYAKYSNTKYEPLYPSIDYFAIKRVDDYTYDSVPLVKVSEHDTPVPMIGNTYEYSWFNNNKCLLLSDTIKFTYDQTKHPNGIIDSVDNIVGEYIKTYYNIDDTDKAKYIRSLYEYNNDWEYYSPTDINNYVYTITIKLK
jgi:hypothetical protein